MPSRIGIRYVDVTYSDSGRPGSFLTVDFLIFHVNYGVTSSSVLSLETDVYGRARPVAKLDPSWIGQVSVRRGELVFGWDAKDNDLIGPRLSIAIQPEQWPDPLKTLRALLVENRAELASAAITTLQALRDDGLVGKLIDPGRADEYPDTDNPHIFAGALLASLSISRYFSRAGSGVLRSSRGRVARFGVRILERVRFS